jgi:thiosulfate dehydrogenase [quinone] large subunit
VAELDVLPPQVNTKANCPLRIRTGDFMTRGNNRKPQDIAVAYLLLRMTIGLNIFIHGLSRLLMGVTVFVDSLVPMFAKTFLPGWSVYAFGLVLPWVETLLGLLLLIGFRSRICLVGCSTLIFVLTFGTSIRQDWNTAGSQLVYAAIFACLLAYREGDVYSLDVLLCSRKGTALDSR